MDIAFYLYKKGRRVFLLQSGENTSESFMTLLNDCVAEMKKQLDDIIIILCCGNLKKEQYRALKYAGADRYILKFETSDPGLYSAVKPSDSLEKRLKCIRDLIAAGYETGSGNIVGLPGQTQEVLLGDLDLVEKLDLTMASSSVFISGEESAYRSEKNGDIDITLNFMALMRIMKPGLMIPSTSSLERVCEGGQYRGLTAGANTVTIHDGTPEHVKKYFPIYSTDRFTPNEDHIFSITKKAGLNIV